MSKQIRTKKVYLKSIDGYVRRYEDEYGTYWYIYDEICDILLVTHRARKDIFNNWLEDYDKAEFNDINNNYKYSLYITTDAVSRMINRNNERANTILKELINNENKEEIYQNTELDVKFNNISNILKQPGVTNFVDLCLEVRDITNMNEYKETLDKYCNDYDIDIEEAVDKIRDYMYEDEVKTILLEADDSLVKLFKEEDRWIFDNWFDQNK